MTDLQIRCLEVTFRSRQRTLTAVDHVDLELPAGQVLGLVGESGSGKSTIARALMGLVPISSGEVRLDGENLERLGPRRRATLRRQMQMVFQDPFASLNPRMTVGQALGEAVGRRHRLNRRGRATEVMKVLELVSLDSRYAGRLPRELSGGQRQRVAIARALAVEPQILLADEITSALDASVQGAILNLVRDIQTRLGLSMLFISHNLALVRYVSDMIAVMYQGRIVEVAPTEQLVSRPQHPYTRALLDAVPRFGAAAADQPSVLDADPPDAHDMPRGCRFHPRCPVGPLIFVDRTICVEVDPQDESALRAHHAACHFAQLSHSASSDPHGTERPAPVVETVKLHPRATE